MEMNGTVKWFDVRKGLDLSVMKMEWTILCISQRFGATGLNV